VLLIVALFFAIGIIVSLVTGEGGGGSTTIIGH
jgi:hypothetical protein